MKISLASLVLMLTIAATSHAQWLPTTVEELATASHLVVIGKITAMHRGQQGPQAFDYAELSVSKVLRGTCAQEKIHLAFPGEKRGYLVGDRNFVSTRMSTDVFFEQDMEGIWFLQATNLENVYMATHPARFKPLFFRAQVEAALSRRP